MDEEILETLHVMARGRNEFFSNSNIRLLNYSSRTSLLTRYMNNDQLMIEMLNRLYTNHLYSTTANAILTLTVPPRFMEPVVISPSQLQINGALEAQETHDSPCAICQEAITSGGVRIRYCRHAYHRSCISNWFSMSVRCPVCRHDIREVGPAAQTSAASSQMSVPPEDQ